MIQTIFISINNFRSMQFLRGQDFLPTTTKLSSNTHWHSLIQIIQQYEQLLQIQKKQLNEYIQQNLTKRLELAHKFCEFKQSLKYEGQTVKKEVSVLESEKLHYFFKGYHYQIIELIQKILLNPPILARCLMHYNSFRKYKFSDFCQNLAFLIYPPYLDRQTSSQYFIQGKPNYHKIFFKSILENWNYCVDLGRPLQQGALDQIIQGYMKTPEVTSYIQLLSMRFLQKINKNKMDVFAFDEQAIKNELQVKKHMAISYQIPKQRTFWDKVFRRKNNDDLQINLSNSIDTGISDKQEKKNIHQIMKMRQQPLVAVIIATIQDVLTIEPPRQLKQMLTMFHEVIIQKYPELDIKQGQGKQQTEGNKASKEDFPKPHMLKHYCYFIMINFILSQLHSKYTISYDGNSMTHADLQNISQIIRVISCIFQGIDPDHEKYKSANEQFNSFKIRIFEFYRNMIIRREQQAEDCSLSTSRKQSNQSSNMFEMSYQDYQLKAMMEDYYQNTAIVSFNDIKILVDILNSLIRAAANDQGEQQQQSKSFVHNASRKKSQHNVYSFLSSNSTSLVNIPPAKAILQQLNLSKNLSSLSFLISSPNILELFSPNKRVSFQHKSIDAENMLFIFRSTKPSIKEIMIQYTGKESPLKHLPLITNILLHQSNLTVPQSLQIVQSLNLIRKLPLYQMKYYFIKMADRFSNLYIKDPTKLEEEFRKSLLNSLEDNIWRKTILLQSKEKLSRRIDTTYNVMNRFKQQLKSFQFYDKISNRFISSVKITAYLHIQNNLFKIHRKLADLKGLKVGSIMVSQDIKTHEDATLRNSFKTFDSISQLIRCVSSHVITTAALIKGRKIDEYNEFFKDLCQLVVSYIQEFLQQNKILQNLNEERLSKIIVGKLQDMIYQKVSKEKILDDDKLFKQARRKINKAAFYDSDIQELNLEREFLLVQGIRLFDHLITSQSIQKKLTYFSDFFSVIFTIIGFSIPKGKISAEIINPIVQYIMLQCPPLPHHQAFYAMKCLKWRQDAHVEYNLTIYQSALTYICKNMEQDYPINNNN